MDASEAAHVERLEESLWRARTRFDPAHLARVLAPDFAEFGRSGRAYALEDVVALPPEPIDAVLPLPGFAAVEVADGVVLATYRSEVVVAGRRQVSNRSSLWLRTATGWRLRFHQGTPLPPEQRR